VTTATIAAPAEANWLFLQDQLLRLRLLLRCYLLEQDAGAPVNGTSDHGRPETEELTHELVTVAERCHAAVHAHDLPLRRLAADFALTPFEIEALLLSLAAELDGSFTGLFARCQPETGRGQPTVALALRLFCADAAGWVQGRRAFSAGGTLRRFGLVRLDGLGETLLASTYHLDERISGYLLGSFPPADAIEPHLSVVPPLPLDQLLQPEAAARLGEIVRLVLTGTGPERLIVNLYGPRGAGRRTLAAAACAEAGLPLIAAPPAILAAESSLPLFFREALLQRAAAFLDCSDLSDEARPALVRACAGSGPLVFLGTAARAGWIEPLPHTTFMTLAVPAPTVAERRHLWQAQLGASLDGQEEALATCFPFTPGDIVSVAESARMDALLRAPADPRLTAGDVWRAARRHPQHRLGELARRIEPRSDWDDIVLPAAARAQLHEIEQQVALQTRVFEHWGFGRKLSRGRGVSALFCGPSGTGKTMAAEVLAGALELELFRIDLSCVVSKYIGETEKNLARVFDEAERSGVILFFDEADALFGKRSEVKDAHDRYANIEINYLLQRMEEFQGLAILATNMRQALDEAFLRRLRFLVEFPFPDAALRAGIWQRAFPPETPQECLDVEFLARQLRVTGGNIRNIALNAAFLAAGEDASVQMAHVMRAAKREFDKIGKACLESDFGPYFALVQQEA